MIGGLFKLGRRVLLIGGEGVVLFTISSAGVTREASVSWAVPNFDDQLVQALNAHNASKPIYLLFDGADQTYRKEENLPKLNMLDRNKFLARKLEMAFPNYPARAMMEIKMPGPKRGGGAWLFVALPETGNLDRLSVLLREANVPVAGFGMLPVESAGLVLELTAKAFPDQKKRSRWAVLVSQHETGGLRQIVTKDGNMVLTRLTPISEDRVQGAVWAEEVAHEFRSTLSYISRLGFTYEDNLDMVVICGEVEKQFFNPRALGAENFACYTPSEAITLLGSRPLRIDRGNAGDAVHAAWTGSKSRLTLPVRVPTLQSMTQPRKIVRVSTAIMLVMLAVQSVLILQAWGVYNSAEESIRNKSTQAEVLRREYEQEAKVYEGLPYKPQLVRSAMTVKELLALNTASPTPLINLVSSLLGEDVRVIKVSYAHDPSSALELPSAGVVPSAQVQPQRPVLPYAQAQQGPRPGEERGVMSFSFSYALPDAIALERKVMHAEELVETLRAQLPNHEIRILSQFGNVSRTGRFTGDVGGEDVSSIQGQDAAEIVIRGAPL